MWRHVWLIQLLGESYSTLLHRDLGCSSTPHNAEYSSVQLPNRVQELDRKPRQSAKERMPENCGAGEDSRAASPNIQFSSVAQSCPTLCDPMNRSALGLPVHHQLPEFTQTHVHWVGDAIQPSHPLSSPSPPALSLSPASGSFPMSLSSSHEVAKVLEFQHQHQSFQTTQGWSPLGWTGWISLQSKGLSRVFSNSKCQKHQGSETHSIPLCTCGIYLFFLEPVSTFYTSCIFPPWPRVFHKLSVRHFHFCRNSVLLLSFQHSETLHVIMDSCWE